MRYQKWGKAGYKLSCYSQQTSKTYLIHDPNCDNPKPWADEVEEAVVQDFLRRTLEINGTEEKKPREASPEDLLAEQLALAEKKLSRLYALYAERDDYILLESIESHRKSADAIREKLERERARREEAGKHEKAREEIRALAQAWPHMTVDERRTVLREAIDKIEINGPDIDISYRL